MTWHTKDIEIREICDHIQDLLLKDSLQDLSQIAILTRTNNDAKSFEKCLIERGI